MLTRTYTKIFKIKTVQKSLTALLLSRAFEYKSSASPMEREPQERVKSVNNITKVVDFGAKFWSILKIRYKQQFSN